MSERSLKAHAFRRVLDSRTRSWLSHDQTPCHDRTLSMSPNLISEIPNHSSIPMSLNSIKEIPNHSSIPCHVIAFQRHREAEAPVNNFVGYACTQKEDELQSRDTEMELSNQPSGQIKPDDNILKQCITQLKISNFETKKKL